MEFVYERNGKRVYATIPKNNRYVPPTKRLRKKKFWLKCGDCNTWFKRYSQSHGKRSDGKSICHSCLKDRIKRARPDLFQAEKRN